MLVRFEVDCAWGANKSALHLPSGGSLGKIYDAHVVAMGKDSRLTSPWQSAFVVHHITATMIPALHIQLVGGRKQFTVSSPVGTAFCRIVHR